MRRAAGFTLIELIMVIVVISVGLAGLATMFSNSNLALATGEDVQKNAQYAQECAELVLGVRRDFGFDSAKINTTMCDPPDLPALDSGFDRAVAATAAYLGSSSTACPEGAGCRDITITVSRGSVTTVVTLMLVQ